MAATTLIPVEEYLRTTYHPDRDYVEGEVQERNLGERWHSSVQAMLTAIFTQHRREWGLVAFTEQRVQVTSTRFRVPDVCVLRTSEPFTPIIYNAPVLCVEILSPEDRFDRTLEKVEDYLQLGVPQVWIIDPRSRRVWTVDAGGRATPFHGAVLSVPQTSASLAVPEIFALLDEAGEGPTR